MPYPPGLRRTVIAQESADFSHFLDVLGRPRKNKCRRGLENDYYLIDIKQYIFDLRVRYPHRYLGTFCLGGSSPSTPLFDLFPPESRRQNPPRNLDQVNQPVASTDPDIRPMIFTAPMRAHSPYRPKTLGAFELALWKLQMCINLQGWLRRFPLRYIHHISQPHISMPLDDELLWLTRPSRPHQDHPIGKDILQSAGP